MLFSYELLNKSSLISFRCAALWFTTLQPIQRRAYDVKKNKSVSQSANITRTKNEQWQQEVVVLNLQLNVLSFWGKGTH